MTAAAHDETYHRIGDELAHELAGVFQVVHDIRDDTRNRVSHLLRDLGI